MSSSPSLRSPRSSGTGWLPTTDILNLLSGTNVHSDVRDIHKLGMVFARDQDEEVCMELYPEATAVEISIQLQEQLSAQQRGNFGRYALEEQLLGQYAPGGPCSD